MRSAKTLVSDLFRFPVPFRPVEKPSQTGRVVLPLFSIVSFTALSICLVSMGCGAGGVRPTFSYFPQAIIDTVPGSPESAVEHLGELVTEEGLELRWTRIREGYVETEWFNPETGEVGGGGSLDTKGIMRIRFWADLVLEHQTQVVVEVVRRRIFDPSLPVRETEIGVPQDHPVYELVQRIMTNLTSGEDGHEH